ncbi:polynucleotide kinase-phosphatase [Treponema sp. OMZ 803]|uniref:polynucleotide kinase-phosphatase n=1 Tax=Treponema sp. OMZ 803 TaxID=120682 RepID=UPI0020A48AD8|nr:polynucleotide kinase-phosphatase [Treponema sp. OMZ 803]UTC52687.1 polynucleotide kinase-phosphatase [Treponema sp. OMZ 803]
MEIRIPKTALVLLVGASGSGKSSFAKKHFAQYETVSSDACRGIVSNDENNQAASNDAFELFYYIISMRLKKGLLTVADATNIQPDARKKLISIARSFHVLPVAIVFDMPQELCETRNQQRTDRNVPPHVIRRQLQDLKRSLKSIKKEGFKKLYTFRSEEEVNNVPAIVREKLYNDKAELHGPFDIIGDVHGCYEELIELLQKLRYIIEEIADDGTNYGLKVSHLENRTVIFLGDLIDRGPASPAVLKLVMSMVRSGTALCVPGNHDMKLHKKLTGKAVQEKHGLAETLRQLEGEPDAFKNDVKEFLYGLVSHYVLDSGKLVVAHAGLKEEMQGRGSGAVRSFCLYGETTGETDEFGLPVRYNWAAEYRGRAKVVYGHTPVPSAQWLNNTIDIDTGCVSGGSLTALRYPEEELVSVPAHTMYCEPVKPLEAECCGTGSALIHEVAATTAMNRVEPASSNTAHNTIMSLQQQDDDVLDIEDVTGRRIVQTRLKHNILIRQENSIAALEAVSRFAVNPKWLIYLPPTMSPCETSALDGFLEYPAEAIGYYKSRGVQAVVCEEKHMGSRAVLVICKDEQTAAHRFGITGEGFGICYTRTGRNFFNEPETEQAFLTKVRDGLTRSGFWEKHQTDWVCLDAELMPWSVKAQSLIQAQYAATGSAALNALAEAEAMLRVTAQRGIEGAHEMLHTFAEKKQAAEKFVSAYRAYCWEVTGIDDYKLAPFHILATEGAVHADKTHQWHMEQIAEICHADSTLFKLTPYKIVHLDNEAEIADAVRWWLELTGKGGEGMVVKPYQFTAYGTDGMLLQPAVKCRGKEYLRIIYGPEYCKPENLTRLKKRGLAKKRSLALREFALGIEALERFVRKEPLRRIHESAFGVLAMESEPTDPRL